ncbi:hypothetical protein H2200_011574 [Cladophialophora chaetospira]|uniref:Ricin B lectin domain-containing protein n=1 Tax=Cladophialophora chaetospira TaxID=386627 RepID=A0AA38WZK2_9EURO|nr:hypothetical protein H2200_011574 [Cladophialophora chaetospira]
MGEAANSTLQRTESSTPSSFDSRYWYKIKNAARPSMSLDVINDGTQQHDGKIQLAADGDFSGQYWQLSPSRTDPGTWNLCTMWLGRDRVLDVYGDDKTTPHLTAAGNYSGQQWRIDRYADGTFRLTNLYSEGLVLAANGSENGVRLRDARGEPAERWILQLERPIRENGFGVLVNGTS